MPKAPAKLSVIDATPLADRWAKARRYVDAATLFQRASLAAQIMAGIELTELRKLHDVKPGRPAKLPHDVVITESWPQAVKKHLGISDQTAYRWIDMAKAARPRLAKSDVKLGAILEKHPGALTPAEQELLKVAVHKISDGKTQTEFLLECGVTKAPQGSGAKGGKTTPSEPVEPDTNAATTSQIPEGWDPQAWQLHTLVTEALEDGWWNDCTEARRRELHGLLIDAQRAIAETLKTESRSS